jgi:hypothetical protein
MVWIVYSKSKIHGIYEDYDIALRVKRFLEEKGGYNNGIPKRFYYMDEIQMNKMPKGMEI